MSNFTMYAGDSKVVEITVVDEDDLVVDITGFELFWELARMVGHQPLLEKALGTGLVLINGPAGRFNIEIDPADTETLQGSYIHEARLVDGDDVSTIMQGTVTITATQIDIDS